MNAALARFIGCDYAKGMRRLSGLQYVRGIAACGVLAYHAADRAGVRLSIGEAGVDLFFVLSGLLMWAITDETSRPGTFLIDRLKRILPGYWAATTVMLAGALAGLFPQVRLSVGHVFASYAFLPWTSPSNGQVWPLLVPGWTLNYEMAFYGLFALVLLCPRGRQLGLLTLVLAGLALAGWAVKPESTAIRFYTDPHILEFLGGLWLGRWWEKGGPKPAMAPLLLAGAVVGLGLSHWMPAEWPKTVLYGAPALLSVVALLAFERRPGGVGGLPWLGRLGDASYSIYLWHTLALSVSTRAVHMLRLPTLPAILLNVVAGLAAGYAGYWLVERPMIRFFAERRHRARQPVAELV